MRSPHSTRSRISTGGGAFLAGAALALLLPGAAGVADDTDLFRTSVPPNILLMVDNSSSMTNSVVVPEYEVPIICAACAP